MPGLGPIKESGGMGTVRALATPEPEPETKWLALVLAELFRTGLALIAKKYPEAKGKAVCSKCGHRG